VKGGAKLFSRFPLSDYMPTPPTTTTFFCFTTTSEDEQDAPKSF
jgi:hypothetical protein